MSNKLNFRNRISVTIGLKTVSLERARLVAETPYRVTTRAPAPTSFVDSVEIANFADPVEALIYFCEELGAGEYRQRCIETFARLCEMENP